MERLEWNGNAVMEHGVRRSPLWGSWNSQFFYQLNRPVRVEGGLQAVEDDGAPMVWISGGEPSSHRNISAAGRGAGQAPEAHRPLHQGHPLKGTREAGWFKPIRSLSLSVHMEEQAEHDGFAVCREGMSQEAIPVLGSPSMAVFG